MPVNTKISEVMSTDPVVIGGDLPIADAADRMAELGVSALPVVDHDRRLIGLLRDDDLIVSEARVHAPRFLNILGATIPLPGEMKHLEAELRKVAGSTAGDLMEPNPSVTHEDDSLEDAATLMHESSVNHLPVVDGAGKVVGMLTRADIVRFIARTT